jgi:hypothetical protein
VDAVRDDHTEFQERESSIERLRQNKRLTLSKERNRYNVVNFTDKQHVWGPMCATIDYPEVSLYREVRIGKRRVSLQSSSVNNIIPMEEPGPYESTELTKIYPAATKSA